MMKGEFSQYFLAFRGERKKDFAAIILRARAMDKPSALEAVHEFDSAVMTDLHAIRQFADARPHAGRHPFDRQQELILAPLHPGPLYYLLAEVEETADLEAEFRQRLVVRQGELLHAAIGLGRDPMVILLYRNTI
jgi:hypothetical protein